MSKLFGGGKPKPDAELARLNAERANEVAKLKAEEDKRKKEQLALALEEASARKRKLRGVASLLSNGFEGFGLGGAGTGVA